MSSSIPSWQISTAHAQPFRGARDLAFCLKVPLDSLLVWASSEGSGETARMRRLAWTFAARIGDKYQIRLTRSIKCFKMQCTPTLFCLMKLSVISLERTAQLTTYVNNLYFYQWVQKESKMFIKMQGFFFCWSVFGEHLLNASASLFRKWTFSYT